MPLVRARRQGRPGTSLRREFQERGSNSRRVDHNPAHQRKQANHRSQIYQPCVCNPKTRRECVEGRVDSILQLR